MLRSDLGRPAFDGWSGNFDCGSTASADEVVVMASRAQAVTRFTIVGDDHVNCAVGSECLQGAVHRREPDRIVALSQQIMNLLRASEVVETRQHRDNCGSLLGIPTIGR